MDHLHSKAPEQTARMRTSFQAAPSPMLVLGKKMHVLHGSRKGRTESAYRRVRECHLQISQYLS